MKILNNISLKKYNTLGVNLFVKRLYIIENIDELINFVRKNNNYYVLGGGSNIVITERIKEKKILKLDFKNKKIKKENNKNIFLEVESGENWHNFVKYCIKKKYAGIENLALIYGSIGGAIVGNIGAYGSEIKDFVYEVKVFDKIKNKIFIFSNKECFFEYRNSIFKKDSCSRYIVLSAVFKLKKNQNDININFKELRDFFQDKEYINSKDVFNKVIEIRKNKLVDPKEFGNAGSFFKNPIVNKIFFNKINSNNDIPFFEVDKNKVKIPAAFLIEKAGYKGYTKNNVGISSKHSLILINKGKATGEDILEFSKIIKEKVYNKFCILLEEEVKII